MGWRDEYKVHPAADVLPMMSDEELAKLGEDIKAHGLKFPIVLFNEWLIDGRNRLEAMERAGLKLDHLDQPLRVHCGDPASWVLTLNFHRRHLIKQEC